MGNAPPRQAQSTFSSDAAALAREARRRVMLRARVATDTLVPASRDLSKELAQRLIGRLRALPVTRAVPATVFWDAWEFAQSIQGWATIKGVSRAVPMIAGKPTLVRAYLNASTPVEVRGELEAAPSASGPWRTIPCVNDPKLFIDGGSSLTDVDRRRKRFGLHDTLDFLLDKSLAVEGSTLWLRMGSVWEAGAASPPLPSPDQAASVTSITFEKTPPLRLRVVNFRYRTTTSKTRYQALATDLDHLRSWLTRAYPIGDLQWQSVLINATTWQLDPSSPENGPAALLAQAQLAAIRLADLAAGSHPLTYYYGLVTDTSGAFMRGLTARPTGAVRNHAYPEAASVGPTGARTWGWDADGSYGDWYGGHEIGHVLGRDHPGFCGLQQGKQDDPDYPYPGGKISDAPHGRDAYMGYDLGDPSLGITERLLPGRSWFDMMTYCNNEWVSDYTWGWIRQALADAENERDPNAYPGLADETRTPGAGSPGRSGGSEPAPGPDKARSPDPDAPMAYLVALIDLNAGTGEICYVLPSTPATEIRPSHEGRLAVRRQLRDGSSDTVPVMVMREVCGDTSTQAVPAQLVMAAVPTPQEVTALELLIDGEPADRFESGPEPTPVHDLRIETSGVDAEATADDSPRWVALAWADDQAGRPGRGYTVQVSTDGGHEWVTLAVHLSETRLEFSPNDFAEYERVQFRVLCSNGLTHQEARLAELAVGDLGTPGPRDS